MDFPEDEAIRVYVERLAKRNRDVAIRFVFVELQAGLSSCRIIRDSQIMTEAIKSWHLAYAERAFQVAEVAMWRVKIAHPEFDQIMALAERLKFELQNLKQG